MRGTRSSSSSCSLPSRASSTSSRGRRGRIQRRGGGSLRNNSVVSIFSGGVGGAATLLLSVTLLLWLGGGVLARRPPVLDDSATTSSRGRSLPSPPHLRQHSRFLQASEQTNVVLVGITLQDLRGPLGNVSALVLEAETSNFLQTSILSVQEADNDLLTSLKVETTVVSQQRVGGGGGDSAGGTESEGGSDATTPVVGTWLIQLRVELEFRLPVETSTQGGMWVREAWNSASERSDYVERLKSKTDPSFADLGGVARVMVDGLQVDLSGPVQTEFVDLLVLLRPATKTLRDGALQAFETITSSMIATHIRSLNGTTDHPNYPALNHLFVDASLIRQRLLLPDVAALQSDASSNVTALLLSANESLSLEISLDVQVDYRPIVGTPSSSSSASLNTANVTAWVYDTFATLAENYTAQLRLSGQAALASVELVLVHPDVSSDPNGGGGSGSSAGAPNGGTTADNDASSSNSNSAASNQNLIGIIAGAIMLGIAVSGLLLFVYQQYSYHRKLDVSNPAKGGGGPTAKRPPTGIGKKGTDGDAAWRNHHHPHHQPELILETYRDLCLGKQEDVSTLGESLGGVTSQKIIKEGDYTRVDL